MDALLKPLLKITVQLDITLVEAIKDQEEIMVMAAAMEVGDRDAGASRAEAQEAQEVLEALEEAVDMASQEALMGGSSGSTTTSSSMTRSPYPLITSSAEATAANGGA